jgi:hypothetical protein
LRPYELRLTWNGLFNAEYTIETSPDLRNWVRIHAEITSPAEGWFEAIAAPRHEPARGTAACAPCHAAELPALIGSRPID